AQAGAHMFGAPESLFAHVPGASRVAAAYELLYRLGKDYEKPAWDIHDVTAGADGVEVSVAAKVVLGKPFCRLLPFQPPSSDTSPIAELQRDPVVLVVAPLSGHHATLLRDTVHTLLSAHDVYITDWIDARMVPLREGLFSLDDYVGYVRAFIHHIGAERLHV